MVGHMQRGGKRIERIVPTIDLTHPPHEVLEIPGKKSAVYIECRVKCLKRAIPDIFIRLITHYGEKSLCITANHAAVAPGYYSREQRHCLYVTQIRKPAWKLHRVIGYECRTIDSLGLLVKEQAKFF